MEVFKINKIYCILGKSASGKSTIERLLEEKGLKRLISVTTRPMRENEKNGIDYFYITEQEFENLKNNDKLLEHTEYRNWHYGLSIEQIDMNDNEDYLAVIEPHGYRQIKEKLGEKVVGIYITVQDKERLIRALNREVFPDVDEIIRRFISDKELFKDIGENVDCIFDNWYSYEVVNSIMKVIEENRPEDIETWCTRYC
jgi:guanylate kinase